MVGVSTDKACKPVNVMGMTKAVQERIFVSANILTPATRFVCVRYGNVLASRGSVIPLFHEQIRLGGPVTVTVPEMTRFLLSLDEAVDTVFEALPVGPAGRDARSQRARRRRVMDIARALVGRAADRDPGRRASGRARRCTRSWSPRRSATTPGSRGGFFAIRSMLPGALPAPARATALPLGTELSSADAVVALGRRDRAAASVTSSSPSRLARPGTARSCCDERRGLAR